MLPHPPF